MGSAVPAAITGLAAAWQAQLVAGVTVEVGTPADLLQRDHVRFVTGTVSDWAQNWGVTPHQGVSALEGGRDEHFTLTARVYRKRTAGTLLALLADIDPDRVALEVALRTDPTLGGALSASGMAQIVSADLVESQADERTREVGLTVLVRCRAWIS